jgi:hypothetical protein
MGGPDEIAGSCDLLMKPARRDIESIGPSGCSEFEKYALEVVEISQWLDHRTSLSHDSGEVIFADGTVAESKLEAMAPDPINSRYLDHHPDLLSDRAEA